MKDSIIHRVMILVVAGWLISRAVCLASTPPRSIFDMSLEELGTMKVSIATRDERSIDSAPGIITVVTKQEFADRNPRTLLDILKLVPGINVVIESLNAPLLQLRGTGNRQNNILLMIDGVRLNSEFFGGITYVIKDIPVEMIERVEIIRGPGSALYGSNAFEAVVNVITVTESFNEKESGLYGRAGTNDTFYGGAVLKKEISGFKIVAGVAGDKSDGPSHGYTDRSGMRGEIDYPQKISNFYANINKDDFGLTTFYSREKIGGYLGIRRYLNDGTDREYATMALEGRYSYDFSSFGTVRGKISYTSFDYDCQWELLPSAIYPPNGFLKHAEATDSRLGGELIYRKIFFDSHDVMAGGNFHELRLFNSSLEQNSQDNPYEMEQIDGSWIDEDRSYHYSFFIQDNFDIADLFDVTVGGRYDKYTRFGDAFSPRIGISHSFENAGYMKLLYGQSFRAPAYYESNINPNGGLLSNDNINPERLKSWEFQYSVERESVSGSINLYYLQIVDLIATVKLPAGYSKDNVGDVESYGFEAEFRKRFFHDMHSIIVNGYFNYSENEEGKRIRRVPNYGANVMLDNQWCDWFTSSIQMRYTGRMKKYDITDGAGNVITKMDDVPDSVTVDMTLAFHFGNMDIRFSAFNIFDEDVVAPATEMLNDAGEPLEDYPWDRRFLMAGFEFHF